MSNEQLSIEGFGVSLSEKIARAHELLKQHEPADGYYVAFSGGKDSTVILDLCQQAGVKHEAFYNNTTIDPPELVKHIKQHYPYVKWNNPAKAMLTAVADGLGVGKIPPTRQARWCCELYKERGGNGRTKVIGVRAAESGRRARLWKERTKHRNGFDDVICPIIYWSDADVWDYIRARKLPYCHLYDEGFTRLGCVGCPLVGANGVAREFARWPRYEYLWRKAVIANWQKWHIIPREKPRKILTKIGIATTPEGEVYDLTEWRLDYNRFHASFKSGEEMWEWWISGERREDPFYEGCQSGLLYTNQPDDETL